MLMKMWQKKKICFSVTWNFKIGTFGRKVFFFVQNFYMEVIGQQYVRMEKSHGILLKSLKKIGLVVKNYTISCLCEVSNLISKQNCSSAY